MRLILMGCFLFLAICFTWAQDHNVEVFKGEEKGETVLRHSVIVSGSVQEVWDLFTTTEGCKSWMTPFAHIDFKEGGLGETSYSADAKPGDASNIVARYSQIHPLKSYKSKLERLPENNPYGKVLMDLHSEVAFEDLGNDQVKVSIAMIGWNDSKEHQDVMKFFEGGNTWYCNRLVKRCIEGPLKWEGVN